MEPKGVEGGTLEKMQTSNVLLKIKEIKKVEVAIRGVY